MLYNKLLICVLICVVAIPILVFLVPNHGPALIADLVIAAICGGAAWCVKNEIFVLSIPNKTQEETEQSDDLSDTSDDRRYILD